MIPRSPKAGQIELHGRRLIQQKLVDACDTLLCEIVHLCRYRRLLNITTSDIVAATEHVSQAIRHIDLARDALAPEGDE